MKIPSNPFIDYEFSRLVDLVNEPTFDHVPDEEFWKDVAYCRKYVSEDDDVVLVDPEEYTQWRTFNDMIYAMRSQRITCLFFQDKNNNYHHPYLPARIVLLYTNSSLSVFKSIYQGDVIHYNYGRLSCNFGPAYTTCNNYDYAPRVTARHYYIDGTGMTQEQFEEYQNWKADPDNDGIPDSWWLAMNDITWGK